MQFIDFPPFFGAILFFVLGLCFGSFLNLMAIRLLAEEPFVMPASHCTRCNKPLRWFHNIPVVSFLLLGGHCGFCKSPISIQYPLAELATGLLFALSFKHFGLSWPLLFVLFFVSNLVVIFLTDLRESLIYQINSLPLVPAGILFHLLGLAENTKSTALDLGMVIINVPDSLISSIVGVIAAIVFFEGLILFSKLVFNTEGFGHGDTHLMMGTGAFLGWQWMFAALLIGFFVQAIPAIPMLVWQWIKNKQYPTLISGGMAVFFGLLPSLAMQLNVPVAVRLGLGIASLVLAVVSLLVFLTQIKSRAEFTYMPLGPALIVGILVMLFWGSAISQWYQSLLIPA
ncbi:MAG: prepilin peptidase [Cyanobacteria bacterium P01_H01_bin.74]